MKKLIAGLVAAVIMLTAPLTASAQSIGEDKYKHAGVGAALNLGLQSVGVKKETAWCITGAVLIGKELYDARHRDRHTPELADIGAGVAGVLVSEGVIWIVHKTW
jgi:hypothetical protein